MRIFGYEINNYFLLIISLVCLQLIFATIINDYFGIDVSIAELGFLFSLLFFDKLRGKNV